MRWSPGAFRWSSRPFRRRPSLHRWYLSGAGPGSRNRSSASRSCGGPGRNWRCQARGGRLPGCPGPVRSARIRNCPGRVPGPGIRRGAATSWAAQHWPTRRWRRRASHGPGPAGRRRASQPGTVPRPRHRPRVRCPFPWRYSPGRPQRHTPGRPPRHSPGQPPRPRPEQARRPGPDFPPRPRCPIRCLRRRLPGRGCSLGRRRNSTRRFPGQKAGARPRCRPAAGGRRCCSPRQPGGSTRPRRPGGAAIHHCPGCPHCPLPGTAALPGPQAVRAADRPLRSSLPGCAVQLPAGAGRSSSGPGHPAAVGDGPETLAGHPVWVGGGAVLPAGRPVWVGLAPVLPGPGAVPAGHDRPR